LEGIEVEVDPVEARRVEDRRAHLRAVDAIEQQLEPVEVPDRRGLEGLKDFVAAYKKALGEDSVPVNYSDIEAADCFFVTGANPAWCHPILWRRVEAHKAANPHVRIIVSDPRQTDTAALADCYLPIRPGTDITLHHAIGRILIERAVRGMIPQNRLGRDVYRKLKVYRGDSHPHVAQQPEAARL